VSQTQHGNPILLLRGALSVFTESWFRAQTHAERVATKRLLVKLIDASADDDPTVQVAAALTLAQKMLDTSIRVTEEPPT
jgi:hypothetical protein